MKKQTIHCFSTLALITALLPLSAVAAESEIPIANTEAPPILYQLPPAYSATSGPIDLTVSVEGREVHNERITFRERTPSKKPRLADSPVFELLAGAPDRRTWLGHLAEKAPGIELQITIDGQEIERLGWTEVQDRSLELGLSTLQPIQVQFAERLAGLPTALRQGLPNKARNLEECLEDCEDDYYACGTTTACQNSFISCASSCGFTGACTPNTTESSTLTPLGFQFSGEKICTGYWPIVDFDLDEYGLYGDRYRRTTTIVHTNFYCRQTTTVEVDYVLYNQCWDFISGVCSPGTLVFSTPYNTHLLCN